MQEYKSSINSSLLHFLLHLLLFIFGKSMQEYKQSKIPSLYSGQKKYSAGKGMTTVKIGSAEGSILREKRQEYARV